MGIVFHVRTSPSGRSVRKNCVATTRIFQRLKPRHVRGFLFLNFILCLKINRNSRNHSWSKYLPIRFHGLGGCEWGAEKWCAGMGLIVFLRAEADS